MNDQIMEILRALAEKFGTTTEFLWSIMVKQSYVYGVTFIVGLVASAVFVAAWNYAAWKINDRDNADWEIALGFGKFWGVVFAAAWMMIFLCSLIDITTSLVNPEYFAIKQVGQLFTK